MKIVLEDIPNGVEIKSIIIDIDIKNVLNGSKEPEITTSVQNVQNVQSSQNVQDNNQKDIPAEMTMSF